MYENKNALDYLSEKVVTFQEANKRDEALVLNQGQLEKSMPFFLDKGIKSSKGCHSNLETYFITWTMLK